MKGRNLTQCDALGLDNSDDQTQNTTMCSARVIKVILFTQPSSVEANKAFCSLQRHHCTEEDQ
jgi:hypothetical protein